MISDLPFQGPVGAVRIGLIGDDFIINPTLQESEESDLDLVVAGTSEAISMVEAGAREVDEETLLEALQIAHDEIKRICAVAARAGQGGRQGEVRRRAVAVDAELLAAIEKAAGAALEEATLEQAKLERRDKVAAVRAQAAARTSGRDPDPERTPPPSPPRSTRCRRDHPPPDRGREAPPGRPQGRRDPADHLRGRRRAARPRLRPVHPR